MTEVKEIKGYFVYKEKRVQVWKSFKVAGKDYHIPQEQYGDDEWFSNSGKRASVDTPVVIP